MSERRRGEKSFYFAWLELLVSCRLPSSAKHVGMVLALHSDYKTGKHAHPGVELLVMETGLSQATVRRGLAALEEIGLISLVSRGGSRKKLANEYDLAHPDSVRALWAFRGTHQDDITAHRERSSESELRSSGLGTPLNRDRNSAHRDP